MAGATLFRGRLNGVSEEDPGDTTSPAGEKAALVTVIKEDSDAGGVGEHLKVKVLLPNGVPCPLYAANLHLFGLVNGPTTLPLALALQPHVIVRRDMSASDGTTCCWNIVISPQFAVKIDYKWAGTANDPIAIADQVSMTFMDGTGISAAAKMGYCAQGIFGPNMITFPFVRMPISGLPDGHTHAWILSGGSVSNHAHLLPGGGISGGGVAFACFAPSTKDEANTLGYTDLI